ncbi:MAG: hypothetical protein ABI693_28615 [Bryobacteraceae bacterium]
MATESRVGDTNGEDHRFHAADGLRCAFGRFDIGGQYFRVRRFAEGGLQA